MTTSLSNRPVGNVCFKKTVQLKGSELDLMRGCPEVPVAAIHNTICMKVRNKGNATPINLGHYWSYAWKLAPESISWRRSQRAKRKSRYWKIISIRINVTKNTQHQERGVQFPGEPRRSRFQVYNPQNDYHMRPD
jgi:hypothetical protein